MQGLNSGLFGLLGLVFTFSAASARAESWGVPEKLKEFVSRENALTNARLIDRMGLLSSSLPEEQRPWSDTAWPDVKGSIAYPYGEGALIPRINFLFWGPNRPFIANRGAHQDSITTASQSAIDALAPSEKYDLLMGDADFTLTRQVVAMVDKLASVDLVSSWSGVCHGWSPASLTLPRPRHSFQMMSPSGRSITFYPSDVKALASFLWGKSLAQNYMNVEGWQCQSGAKTNKYGRLQDPRCFDVNPSFFHLLLVNQLGLNKRGLIMDRTYRAQVFNQPVWGYKMSYFRITDRHPRAGLSLDQAKVPYGGMRFDPSRHYRAANVANIVGVEATLWYAKERNPVQADYDGPEFDKTKDMTIRYDIELDANDEIIGGEWREYDDVGGQTLVEQIAYKHPDIVWLAPPTLKAYSIADADIAGVAWNGQGALPEAWRKAAVKAASFEQDQTVKGQVVRMPVPQPLAKVVDLLIQESRK